MVWWIESWWERVSVIAVLWMAGYLVAGTVLPPDGVPASVVHASLLQAALVAWSGILCGLLSLWLRLPRRQVLGPAVQQAAEASLLLAATITPAAGIFRHDPQQAVVLAAAGFGALFAEGIGTAMAAVRACRRPAR